MAFSAGWSPASSARWSAGSCSGALRIPTGRPASTSRPIIAAIVGAIIVVYVWNMVTKRGGRAPSDPIRTATRAIARYRKVPGDLGVPSPGTIGAVPDQPYETLLHQADGGVATLTLNRPDALNALNARDAARAARRPQGCRPRRRHPRRRDHRRRTRLLRRRRPARRFRRARLPPRPDRRVQPADRGDPRRSEARGRVGERRGRRRRREPGARRRPRDRLGGRALRAGLQSHRARARLRPGADAGPGARSPSGLRDPRSASASWAPPRRTGRAWSPPSCRRTAGRPSRGLRRAARIGPDAARSGSPSGSLNAAEDATLADAWPPRRRCRTLPAGREITPRAWRRSREKREPVFSGR